MFKIGIRWPLGMLKVDVDPKMTIGKLLFEVSQKIKVAQRSCKLYRSLSPKSTYIDELNQNSTVEEENIKKGDIIYLDVSKEKLPQNVPVGQHVMKYDVIDEFKPKDEKIPETVRNVRCTFGKRVISSAFYDMKERGIPAIIYQLESSCYAFRVAQEAIQRFQYISLQDHCAVHRVLLLFGRLNEETGKVSIHCSVQPPQKNFADHFEINSNFNMTLCLEIANMFGMKLLGMAVSHPYIKEPNKERANIPLPAYLIELAAKFQELFGEYFTTLVCTPFGNDLMNIEAFQVTDAVVKLTQLNLIDEEKSKETKDFCKIYFKQDIRVFEQKKRWCHVNLCICAVRIRKIQSKIPSHDFPTLAAEPSETDVQKYFKNNELCPSWRRFFDFNLLVYLALTGIELSTMRKIVNSIVKMEDIPKYILDQIGSKFHYSF